MVSQAVNFHREDNADVRAAMFCRQWHPTAQFAVVIAEMRTKAPCGRARRCQDAVWCWACSTVPRCRGISCTNTRHRHIHRHIHRPRLLKRSTSTAQCAARLWHDAGGGHRVRWYLVAQGRLLHRCSNELFYERREEDAHVFGELTVFNMNKLRT